MNKKHRVDIKITDDMVTINSTTRLKEEHLDKIRKCPGVYSTMAVVGQYSMTILVGEAFDILETVARAIIVLIGRSRLDRLDIRGEHADEIRLLAVNEQLKELDTAIKEALKKSDKCRKKAGRLNKRRIRLYMRGQELRQQEA
ncbi:hypothetical protein HG445_001660 [Candidatus Saccharibacteria bacterium]|nr:hypothetical protein [Candidatus Saccharibacteria bacterium]